MSKFRYGAALLAAKASVVALRITRHNGTNFPGVVALKICPDFLKYIKKPEQIFGVTGTNGKTTVSNLLKDTLQELDIKVLNNSLGSNINTGITTCLVSGVTLFGKQKYEKAVLEIDERSSRHIFPYLKPDYLIVTNLSRDSIMRNGHPEYIGRVLTKYIPEETKLILNGDDLLSANVAPKNKRVYFGIEKMEGDLNECETMLNDMQICPVCHNRLEYEYVRYSSIGKAYCPGCGFASPKCDLTAFDVNKDGMTMKIHKTENPEEAMDFPIHNQGTFNIYNQVAITTLLNDLGYSLEEIRAAMEKTNIVKSRFDAQELGNKTVITMFSKDKNAYACSRVFEYMKTKEEPKEIILLVNCFLDTKSWSENTCWLYDCNFELLNNSTVSRIVVVGDRGRDYKLRLLMAGIPEEKIVFCQDPYDSVDAIALPEDVNVYVLYGADAVDLGQSIAGKVRERIKAEEGGIKQ